MNEPGGLDAVPLSLRVQDPVAWLVRHDRDPELHETVSSLLAAGRVPEAVLFLEWHIGRTAPVRCRVKGWDGQSWEAITRQLSNYRSHQAISRVLYCLLNYLSERIEP